LRPRVLRREQRLRALQRETILRSPSAARAQAPETFEIVARRFIERYAKLHNKSWRDSERILQREAVPHWRHRPVGSITRVDVVALIDGIVDRGAPAMANRTLAVLRRLFGWCVERGALELSPCERVKDPAPETRRERVHSDAELREIWRAADILGYPFGPVVKLLLLTGARREEVAGMRWSELAADLSLCTLPAERVKNKKKHEIPLNAPARALLAELPRISEFVFSTTGTAPVSGFARAKRRLDQAIIPPLPPWVLHDLRRSLASGMAALGVQLPVVEKILNHVGNSFSGVRGVYQRYDFAKEKRHALELWGRHVLALAQRPRPSNVIDLAVRG
jgi:integrase